jgi:flagellar FlgN protein
VAGFAEASDILWRERELLDVLLFKLDQQRLLLSEGGERAVRWLARASHEIDLVLEELRLADLARAVEVDALAAELGLDPAPTLGELAAAAPAPWNDLFAAHRLAFETLVDQVRAAADDNRHRLEAAASELEQSLLGSDR